MECLNWDDFLAVDSGKKSGCYGCSPKNVGEIPIEIPR